MTNLRPVCPHCKQVIQPGQQAARRPDIPVADQEWYHQDCFDAESSVCPVEVGVWVLMGGLEWSERQNVNAH